MIPAGLRRNTLRALALIVFALLAGATFQGIATALERRELPRPGDLVSVGDHQLHLQCTGEGSPIVVLEAPAAGMSSSWAWVQADVAPVTRVCVYDRAGLGWSEWGQAPFGPEEAVRQLNDLLVAAGERGPYVIAGQGLGAALAVLYAARYPLSVYSVVLVDSPLEGPEPPQTRLTQMASLWPWLARTGVLRLTGLLSERAQGLPPESAARLAAFLNRPDHLTRAATELEAWNDVIARARAVALPEEIPVTRVDVAGRDRIAMLTDETRSAAVSAAILTAIASATH